MKISVLVDCGVNLAVYLTGDRVDVQERFDEFVEANVDIWFIDWMRREHPDEQIIEAEFVEVD